jgi:1,2-diacylglycerol 3-alpha-glucosyltransferase
MRVVIFSDTYPPEINGVATSARNLFRTLNAHDEEALVVTTNPFDTEFSFEDGVIRIPGLEMKHLYGYIMTNFWNKQAMKVLRKFKPDVIHIQTDGTIGQFGFLAASALHCATVYTFHTMMEDYTYYATKGHFDQAARGIVRQYVRYKSHETDEFITPSEKIREYMRSIGVDAYINIIPTGIDFSAFKKDNIDQDKVKKLKEKYHLDKDTYVILSLGRVAKEKSLDVCLRGYAKYLNDKPKQKTRFLLVGGGPELEELKKYVVKLGIENNVTFVGPVNPDTTPLYYSLGDCFVSASTTETQGLTFMEAMASSLVIFVRYDDTLVSTVKDGENGFFFYDEADMAEKLSKIIDLSPTTRKEINTHALKAIEPYSLEKFYQSVKEVYEHAIKKNY